MPAQARLSVFWRATLGAAATMLVPLASAHGAVLISSDATANITCASGVCTPSKKTAILNASQLQSMLAAGNVKVTTGGAKSSDILVSAGLTWVSAHTLTLDAYLSVTISKRVSVTGSGGLTILTNDGGAGGMFSFGKQGSVTFLSLSSPLTINGNAYTLVDSVSTLASDVTAHASGNYALAGDYNASGNSTYVQTPLQGRFEGLGNTISHLETGETGAGFGLFAHIESSGVVENVRLTGFRVTLATSNPAGGIAAINEGLISGSSVAGKITGEISDLGGVVGYNDGGTILGSSSSVTMIEPRSKEGTDLAVIGGLVGFNTGTIRNSFAIGEVNSKAHDLLGGLVGIDDCGGSIATSYATGAITGGNDAQAGGLVGSTCGTNAVITNSYATGSVTTGLNGHVGGLVGESSLPIDSCYSTGIVSGGAGSVIGGLIGADSATSGSISAAYWDTMTSGITNASQGAGNVSNDPGITGETSTQLQSGLPAGFSNAVWGESSGINSGLPYLLALPPAQ